MKTKKIFWMSITAFFISWLVLFYCISKAEVSEKSYKIINESQNYILYSPSGHKIYSGSSVSKLFKNLHHIVNTSQKNTFIFETDFLNGQRFFEGLYNCPSLVKNIEYDYKNYGQVIKITLLEYNREEYIFKIKIL